MPAILLSSAPGGNASPANVTAVSKPAEGLKTTAEPTNILGSFGEKLSASMASLSQESQSTSSESVLDLTKLSASLDELSAQLEELDPALFESLRAFLNGQDLSPEGLQTLQAGGELPTFFSKLQEHLQLETNLEALSDIELSALESSLAELSSLINSLASAQGTEVLQSQAALLGYSFSVVKEGAADLKASNNAQGGWQKYDPQQLSQNANTQNLQSASAGLVSESDKSFTTHLDGMKVDSMKAELSGELADLAEPLLEASQEGKDKAAVSKFSDLQLRTASDTLKPYSTTLSTPVNAKEWADEVSQKIVWFTGRNIQAAEMHLNPADLGPIDVKINVQNDVASVTFNVQNASVRELLESNVVRLREMMESNGVNLGDVNVDSGTQDAYKEAQEGTSHLMAANGESGEIWDEETKIEQVSVKSSNLVDYFV